MNPADRAVRSAFNEAFANYTARAEVNERKALMLDYLMRRGYLTDKEVAEAREFARMEENHDQ